MQIARFLVFRFLALIILLFVASFVVFALLHFGGSDPVSAYLDISSLPQTPELVAELRKEFGLDKPFLEQYILWLSKAIRLDFGVSFMTSRPVSQDFFYYLPNTLLLVALGFTLTIFASLVIGILAFVFRGRFLAKVIRVFCLTGVSMPSFWLAFILVYIFAIKLSLLPAVGSESLTHFILPSIAICLMSVCINSRLILANMLESSKERHILYARARGLDKFKIYTKHILYNAFIPIITSFGMHLGELLGGALFVESIFGIAGIGFYSIQGVANHDYPVILCFVMVICAIFMICNVITDLAYSLLDSRISWHLRGQR